MNRKTVGIVDYGVGNQLSVLRAFQRSGAICRVSCDLSILAAADILVLPGVGAFPVAMRALHLLGLVSFLGEMAQQGKPLIGLCLGMQLLADHSSEHGNTVGLGLIPGKVHKLPVVASHIGWNNVEAIQKDALLAPLDGASFYFNHSYIFDCEKTYSYLKSWVNETCFTVAVRRGNIVGLQFHPEKSQIAGKQLLSSLVENLGDA